MSRPNNGINQKIRDSFQYHTTIDFPPDYIFGLRIGLDTNGLIVVFRTEFISAEEISERKNIQDDALNWIEWCEGFNKACIFEHAGTIRIEEFLPRMEAFIASLKILKQSGLPLERQFVEFETTEDEQKKQTRGDIDN